MAPVLGIALLLLGTCLSRRATFLAVCWIVAALVTLSWAGADRDAPGRLRLFAGFLLLDAFMPRRLVRAQSRGTAGTPGRADSESQITGPGAVP